MYVYLNTVCESLTSVNVNLFIDINGNYIPDLWEFLWGSGS